MVLVADGPVVPCAVSSLDGVTVVNDVIILLVDACFVDYHVVASVEQVVSDSVVTESCSAENR